MTRPASGDAPATIADALRRATAALGRSDAPRLDAEVLLAHVLGLTRAQLLARLRAPLDAGAFGAYEALVKRRSRGEPVPYLTGSVGFYGLALDMAPGVLVPRPETELLVDWAIGRARIRGGRIVAVDVGTGCGAIATALGTAVPDIALHATDNSPAALDLAARNVERHGLARRVTLHQADLLPDCPLQFDLVVANLPYIGTDDPDVHPDVVRYEPAGALFAGHDGLAAVRRLLSLLPGRLADGADVGLEIGWRQGAPALAEARAALPSGSAACRADLAGRDRLITVEGVRCGS